MVKNAVAWCVLAVLTGGCTSTKQSSSIDAVFDCDGGARLSVTFENKTGVAVVRTQAGGLHVLPRTISGSGYSYEAEGRTLRGKGRDATWTDAGMKALSCQEAR